MVGLCSSTGALGNSKYQSCAAAEATALCPITEPSLPRSVVWLPCITEDAQYVPFLENLLAKDRQLLQLDCSQQKAAQ